VQKIRPFLWFDGQAAAAAEHYRRIFADSSAVEVGAEAEAGAMEGGTLSIGGLELVLFDGGPAPFSFSQSISLFVSCEDQAEVDRLWEALCEGGEPGQCGWLIDRFGVSWQIVPDELGQLLGGPDPVKAHAALQAMLTMSKLDVAALRAAYDAA
jgi:predicted 3-demethylubiquinone-9 3-methyltransferase (glyoxalase superfamily)